MENFRPNRSNLTCDTNYTFSFTEHTTALPVTQIAFEPKCVNCFNNTAQNLTSASLINSLISAAAIAVMPSVIKAFTSNTNANHTDSYSLNFTDYEDYFNNDTLSSTLFTNWTLNNFDNYTSTNWTSAENSSLFNNITKNYDLEDNAAPKTFEDNVMDFYNAFRDYLSYVISDMYLSLNGSSILNDTDSGYDTDGGYTYFLSTVAPYLNSSDSIDIDQYNNIYSNISTTISTIIETNKHRFNLTIENTTKNESDIKLPCDYVTRSRLRSLCWETMFGQELVKITVMDLVMTALSTLFMDFFRGIFVRVMNNCWCWDLEKKFPNYGDFKVAENILQLVNNQGMVWMGMFFSPGLVVLNVFKLVIIMYLKSWAVLTCNVPHEVIFRASRSNNFYFALLLMMLFLCVLPVGYAIVWKKPSWHCGPFSKYPLIFHIFTTTIKKSLPESLHGILDYIASPGIVIPLLVLLILIIYYLVSLTNSLREANNDLKVRNIIFLSRLYLYVL